MILRGADVSTTCFAHTQKAQESFTVFEEILKIILKHFNYKYFTRIVPIKPF